MRPDDWQYDLNRDGKIDPSEDTLRQDDYDELFGKGESGGDSWWSPDDDDFDMPKRRSPKHRR